MVEGEIEYESDPEEAKLSLKMRRREASDDEEEKAKEREDNRGEKLPTRRIEDSDGESEGAVAEYEDELYEEDYDLDGEYVEEEDEIEYVESSGGRFGDGVEVAVGRAESEKDAVEAEELMKEKRGVGESKNDSNSNDVSEIDAENNNVADGQQEEKKEVEPYAVPTAGAFYMHDDRFRDSAGGRNRRMLGGRKLWESKDDRKWGHDKFEELTLQEKHREGRGRGSRGRYRGRARNRSSDHGYVDGNRSREYTNTSTQNHNNQNNAPKGARGRGSRRYPSSYKNNKEVHLTQNKQSGRSVVKTSYASSVRTSEDEPNAEGDVVPKKQAVSSSLSVASPPFYPSGSSAMDNTVLHKRDAQAGTVNQNGQPSVVDESSTAAQSRAIMRGKNIMNHVGVDKNYLDNPLSVMAGKPSNTFQLPLSGSSSINSVQLRGQGRGITSSTQMAYQPAPSNNQLDRVPPPNQLETFQRGPSQTHARPSVQASSQYFRHAPGGTQTSSPPKAAGAVNAFETGEVEFPSEPNKYKTALVPKEKYSTQGSGRGSFLYGGAQVVGASANMGSGHGDQNFPTFFQVMQFGGQNPGGIGVPAVGMAFPGYVGGRGNSEMTWLPVLAGAAGALGANFRPPYITGSYQGRTSGQVSSIDAAPSKENSAANVSNDWKAGQKPELANDDSGQRQKNPRSRYTEMKFDQ